MVIALAVYPVLVAGGLLLLDAMLPVDLVPALSSSLAVSAGLSFVLLALILAAAYRQRRSASLSSAWLFLFCGVLVLSVGFIVEPFVPETDSWIEELFETVSFFPLLFFVLTITSPLRIMVLPRGRRRRYGIVGAVALVAVLAIVFLPWVVGFGNVRPGASAKLIFRLAKPLLDVILAEPVALFVLAIGLTRGSGPLFLVGLGLLAALPEDIFANYQLVTQWSPFGNLSYLLFLASQLYLLNGTLLSLRKRESPPGA